MFSLAFHLHLRPSEKTAAKGPTFSQNPPSVRCGFWMKMLALEGGLELMKAERIDGEVRIKKPAMCRLAIDDDSYIF